MILFNTFWFYTFTDKLQQINARNTTIECSYIQHWKCECGKVSRICNQGGAGSICEEGWYINPIYYNIIGTLSHLYYRLYNILTSGI